MLSVTSPTLSPIDPMTESIPVEFIVNAESQDQLDDIGLRYRPYGKLLSFTQWLDEVLVESLKPDDLIEFIGVDAEFLVYMNVKG